MTTPEHPVPLTVRGLRIEQTGDPTWTTRFVNFYTATTPVTNPETGKQVGTAKLGLEGQLTLSLSDGREYRIHPDDLATFVLEGLGILEPYQEEEPEIEEFSVPIPGDPDYDCDPSQ